MKLKRKKIKSLIKESKVTLSNYNQFLLGVSKAFSSSGTFGQYDLEKYFVGAGHMTTAEFAYDIMNSGLKYRSSLNATAFSFDLNEQGMRGYLEIAFQPDRAGGVSGTHRHANAAVIFCIPKDSDKLNGMLWYDKFDNDSMLAYNELFIQTVPPQLILCVIDLDKGSIKPNPIFFKAINQMKILIDKSNLKGKPINIYDDIATIR